MSFVDPFLIFQTIATLVAVVSVLVKVFADLRETRTAKERVLEAEKEAFKTVPEAFAAKTADLVASQEKLESRTKQIAELLDTAQASLRVGGLFDLYNKQIEKYQTETQARAG